ncbi:MAG: DUF2911 domain-containing protein [Bacteroidota bacterium]
MNKKLRNALIITGAVIAVGMIALKVFETNMRKLSPPQTAEFTQGDLKMEVIYCSPAKKDRNIFGELIPFGEVWRTGANEATLFTSSKDFKFNGQEVKAGTYTLWTIPGEKEWKVMLNSKMYAWGIHMSGEAQREGEFDVATATVAVMPLASVEENLKIAIQQQEELNMSIAWDQTKVKVPLEVVQ